MYWVDTYLDYIERCDYTGGSRVTVVRGAPVANLYSLSIFQTELFLTSWRENAVLSVNKFNSKNFTT